MSRKLRTTLAAMLGLALCLWAPPVSAAEGSRAARIAEMSFDAVILRPLNLAVLAVGSVAFLGTAPLVAPHGGLSTTWDLYVYGPYEYTFLRGLGDL